MRSVYTVSCRQAEANIKVLGPLLELIVYDSRRRARSRGVKV